MQQSNMSALTAIATLRTLRHTTSSRQLPNRPVPTQQQLPEHYLVIKDEEVLRAAQDDGLLRMTDSERHSEHSEES